MDELQRIAAAMTLLADNALAEGAPPVVVGAGLTLAEITLQALARIASATERLADVAEAQELRAQRAQMELAASQGDGQVVPFPGCPYSQCLRADCALHHKCMDDPEPGWSATGVPSGGE